jgi:metallo-beta-lactamase family protein
MNYQCSISFLGAAGSVTGSRFLVRTPKANILVDCGLFQGLKELRALNREELPCKADEIDIILLTHGHLDHTGYLPKLVKSGYEGYIYGTAPTLEVAALILKDSAKIQMEESENANMMGYSRHKPAEPLYNLYDAEHAINRFRTIETDTWIPLTESIRCRFRYNGHIIGATFIELETEGKRLVFSGDIGRDDDALLFPPERPEMADVLVMESTYGNRLHPDVDERSFLADIVNNTIKNSGTVIIPSFAVERTQLLMHLLVSLRQDNHIPKVPIYLDSPMGHAVFDIFKKYPQWHKLSLDRIDEMMDELRCIRSLRETYAIASRKDPKIIVAASGMGTGGRVLHYFERYIGDPKACIIMVGYQAEGTRGRDLMDGKKEIRFFGKEFPVRARISELAGLSAHADQKGLMQWMGRISNHPSQVFLVHGETDARLALKEKISETYGWKATLPALYESFLF